MAQLRGENRSRRHPPMPAKTETKTESEWQWYFDELPEKDIVTVCKKHIAKLDIIVEECESRFSS